MEELISMGRKFGPFVSLANIISSRTFQISPVTLSCLFISHFLFDSDLNSMHSRWAGQ